MSKKTLEITVTLLKELFDYNIKEFTPIIYNKKKIGWIHHVNVENLKLEVREKNRIN